MGEHAALTGQTPPRQTMEEMADVMATGLGPEIPTSLVSRMNGERVIEIPMPEGATHVRREADDSLGRPTHMANGLASQLDGGTRNVEVNQGRLGCRVLYSHNLSGTTDIVTLGATPAEVRARVQDRRDIQESTARILENPRINGRDINSIAGDFLRASSGIGYPAANNRLGRSEYLQQVLAVANELVTSAGYTHEQLAEPLSAMLAEFNRSSRMPGQPVEYNGRTYRLEGDVARGLESSALTGEQRTIMMVRVVDVETGAALQFDALSPKEIADHGFYGGTEEGVTRHVSPGAIATVFDLQPQHA